MSIKMEDNSYFVKKGLYISRDDKLITAWHIDGIMERRENENGQLDNYSILEHIRP